MIPIVTTMGMRLGSMVGSTVLIESLFVIPGLGSVMMNGISNRDFMWWRTVCSSSPSLLPSATSWSISCTASSIPALAKRRNELWKTRQKEGSAGSYHVLPRVPVMFSRKIIVVCAILLLIMVLIAIFAPVIAPYDPNKDDLYNVLKGCSAEHWLGTDSNGRDVLSRIIYGARISFRGRYAMVAVVISSTAQLEARGDEMMELVGIPAKRKVEYPISFPAA